MPNFEIVGGDILHNAGGGGVLLKKGEQVSHCYFNSSFSLAKCQTNDGLFFINLYGHILQDDSFIPLVQPRRGPRGALDPLEGA